MGVTITVLQANIQVSGCIYINFPFWGGWLGFKPWTFGSDCPQSQHMAHSISPANHSTTGQPKNVVSRWMVLDVALGPMHTITLLSYANCLF